MSVTPSWDLLVIVFVGIVVTYSFIIGAHESIKMTAVSYVALIATLAIGGVISRWSQTSSSTLAMLDIPVNGNVLVIVKLLIFTVMLIALAIRGGFSVHTGASPGILWKTVLTILAGAMNAMLLLTALLTIVTGQMLLSPAITTHPIVAPITQVSPLAQVLVANQELWLSLPALLLLIVGIGWNEK